MLIHPWDGAISDTEWRDWLAAGHDFGQLAVSDPGNGAPHVIPTHFAVDGDTLLVHLARPNKVWAAIQARPIVVRSVVDDYAYIPTTWRAKAGGPDEDGVPTSYYSAVQLTCHAQIVDDPQRKAELLRRQLAHFQPRGDHAQVGADMPPYGRMLSGIRGLRLHIASVAAKFKYDDHNPQEHRARVAERLENRGSGRDRSAAAQQRSRLNRPTPECAQYEGDPLPGDRTHQTPRALPCGQTALLSGHGLGSAAKSTHVPADGIATCNCLRS